VSATINRPTAKNSRPGSLCKHPSLSNIRFSQSSANGSHALTSDKRRAVVTTSEGIRNVGRPSMLQMRSSMELRLIEPERPAVDATTPNVAAHRLENLIHDRRATIAGKPAIALVPREGGADLSIQFARHETIEVSNRLETVGSESNLGIPSGLSSGAPTASKTRRRSDRCRNKRPILRDSQKMARTSG
jgi:hypothetical protein